MRPSYPKALLFFGLFFADVGTLWAQPSYTAVIRDAHGHWKSQTVPLAEFAHLNDPWVLESRDFKIVRKKDDTAIDLWTAPPEVAIPATNVLYHLTVAKKYFQENLRLESVSSQPQLVIRIGITNSFSNLGHFKNDHLPAEYNNALSIAGGRAIEGSGIAPWGDEIWFRPKKEVPIKELLAHLPEDPLNPTLRGIRDLVYPLEASLGVEEILYTLFYGPPTTDNWVSTMARVAGTFALTEGVLQLSKSLNRLLLRKYYFIDTAMIPEVIYHEYSHQALSDYIYVDAWTPVVEGFADYFAAVISKNPEIAGKIKRFNSANHKNGAKVRQFELGNENRPTADFVLSLLWGLRKVFGPNFATAMILEARKEITASSADIRGALTRALVNSCKRMSPDPIFDEQRMLSYFGSRGL